METAKSCSIQHLEQIKEGWNSFLDSLMDQIYTSIADFIKKQIKKFVDRFKERIKRALEPAPPIFYLSQKRQITGFSRFTEIYHFIVI